MTDRLDFLGNAFKRLPQALEQQVEDTVRDNVAFLEDANTAQLAAGKDSTGKDITPEYADLTIALKQIKGQPTDKVTLHDEGDFYRGIMATLGGKQVEMMGTDPKTEKLTEKYGEEILGLPEPAVEEFKQDYLLPDLRQKTRQTLGI